MSTTTCNKFKGEIENYLRNGQNNIESANQAKKMYKDIENYVKDKDISDVDEPIHSRGGGIWIDDERAALAIAKIIEKMYDMA